MAENEKKTELETSAKKTEKAKSDKPSVWKKIGTWFKSVRSECNKIVWASWKSVRSNTAIVLVCVIIISIALAIIDRVLSGAISGLNKLI